MYTEVYVERGRKSQTVYISRITMQQASTLYTYCNRILIHLYHTYRLPPAISEYFILSTIFLALRSVTVSDLSRASSTISRFVSK